MGAHTTNSPVVPLGMDLTPSQDPPGSDGPARSRICNSRSWQLGINSRCFRSHFDVNLLMYLMYSGFSFKPTSSSSSSSSTQFSQELVCGKVVVKHSINPNPNKSNLSTWLFICLFEYTNLYRPQYDTRVNDICCMPIIVCTRRYRYRDHANNF